MLRGDGDRLRQALDRLGWSQTKAAKRSGIRQPRLAEIISGAKGIFRDELRALAKAGVPADYVLGTAAEFAPIGAVRDQRDLELRLSLAVMREVTQMIPPVVPESDEEYVWFIDGKVAFEAAVAAAATDAKRELDKEIERPRLTNEITEAEAVISFVVLHHKEHPGTPDDVVEAAVRLYRRLPALKEKYKQLDRPTGSGALLFMRKTWETYIRHLQQRAAVTEENDAKA